MSEPSGPGSLTIDDPTYKAGFTAVPNILLNAVHLSMSARLTYIYLLRHAWQREECWPGLDVLCSELGASERGVRDWIKELEKANMLTVHRRGQGLSNMYVLHLSAFRAPRRTLAKSANPEVNNFADQEVTDFADQDPTNFAALRARAKNTPLQVTELLTGPVATLRSGSDGLPEKQSPEEQVPAALSAPPFPEQGGVTSEKPAFNKGSAVIDALRAAGHDPTLSPRDFRAIKECPATAERIAKCWLLAKAQAAAGERYWSVHLSIQSAILRMDALEAQSKGGPATARTGPTRQSVGQSTNRVRHA